MNEYLVPSLLGRASLYGSNATVPVSSRIVATLTMHLDNDVLEDNDNQAFVADDHEFVPMQGIALYDYGKD